MRIISQNKDLSINFDNVTIIREGCEIFALLPNGKGKLLGRYESIEEANKIFENLHEICIKAEGNAMCYM